MLYPRQPHMHVCLTLLLCSAVSQVHIHKHTLMQTWVCEPPHIPSECASLGVRGEGSEGRRVVGVGAGWRERQGGVRGVRGSREGRPPTRFSLVHSLHLLSFPPFLELSKESLSPASQLRSSSVQLCHCVCVYVCHIYKYISISDSISVGTCFGRCWNWGAEAALSFYQGDKRELVTYIISTLILSLVYFTNIN